MSISPPSKDTGTLNPYNFPRPITEKKYSRTLDGKSATNIAMSRFETRLDSLDSPETPDWANKKDQFVQAIKDGKIHLYMFPVVYINEPDRKQEWHYQDQLGYGAITFQRTLKEPGDKFLRIQIPTSFYQQGQDLKKYPDKHFVDMVLNMTRLLDNEPDIHTFSQASDLEQYKVMDFVSGQFYFDNKPIGLSKSTQKFKPSLSR